MAKTTTNLTQKDIQTIKKQIVILRVAVLLFMALGSGLSVLFINGSEKYYGIGVTILFAAIGFLFANTIYRKEIKSGFKHVLIGTVTNVEFRQSGSVDKQTAFYLTVDKDEVQIQQSDYAKFKKGQKLELHITEKTSTILKLIIT